MNNKTRITAYNKTQIFIVIVLIDDKYYEISHMITRYQLLSVEKWCDVRLDVVCGKNTIKISVKQEVTIVIIIVENQSERWALI